MRARIITRSFFLEFIDTILESLSLQNRQLQSVLTVYFSVSRTVEKYESYRSVTTTERKSQAKEKVSIEWFWSNDVIIKNTNNSNPKNTNKNLQTDWKIWKRRTVFFVSNFEKCIALAKNPKYHSRSKHIDIKYQFVREKVASGEVELIYCPTNEMVVVY